MWRWHNLFLWKPGCQYVLMANSWKHCDISGHFQSQTLRVWRKYQMSARGSSGFTGRSDRSEGRLIAIVRDHFTRRVLLPFYELFSLLLPLPIINTAQPAAAYGHAYFTWTFPRFWQFEIKCKKQCMNCIEIYNWVFFCHFICHSYRLKQSWLFIVTFWHSIFDEFRWIT